MCSIVLLLSWLVGNRIFVCCRKCFFDLVLKSCIIVLLVVMNVCSVCSWVMVCGCLLK